MRALNGKIVENCTIQPDAVRHLILIGEIGVVEAGWWIDQRLSSGKQNMYISN